MDALHKLTAPRSTAPQLGEITPGTPPLAVKAMHAQDKAKAAKQQQPVWTGDVSAEIEHRYTYHAPTPEQVEVYESLREHAKQFAMHIEAVCPNSREKAIAQTLLQQSVQMANAAIAINTGK